MDIGKSKYFCQHDLDYLCVEGYRGCVVEMDGDNEEIDLGRGFVLYGAMSFCGKRSYCVVDRECRESYLSECSVEGAMFRFNSGDMPQKNYGPESVPDYVRPWEYAFMHCTVSVNRELAKDSPSEVFRDSKRAPVISFPLVTYHTVDGAVRYVVAVSGDGKRMKVTCDARSGDGVTEYVELDAVLGGDGNVLEVDLGDLFVSGPMSNRERTRQFNLKVKSLSDRLR